MSDQNKTTRRELLANSALAAGTSLLLAQAASGQGRGGGGRGGGGGNQIPEPALTETSADTPWMKFFPKDFRTEKIKTTGAVMNTVIGGSGPPVLMFHGAPQSLITWRLIAPELAKEYTLVLCDLRGYGDSSRPDDKPDHSSQSKRPMALDGVEVMAHLGYNQFRMVGHDRGGRVGRRMAIDHPDKVLKLVTLDIIPAHYLYSHVNMDFVQVYFHWFNYLRAAPAPENELKMTNDAQAARGGGNEVSKEYLRNTTDIKMLHAMCEDYRASASVDLKIDEEDLKAGKKIECPALILWAQQNRVNMIYNPAEAWAPEGTKITTKGLPGGHSLQESVPKETLAELQGFLKG